MRLRRLRGLSQHRLALRMGTKQPAIARLEAGDNNTRLSTLVDLATALDATVRIDLEPVEIALAREQQRRWWETVSAIQVNYTTNILFNNTVNVLVTVPARAPLSGLVEDEEMVEFDPLEALPAPPAVRAIPARTG